MPDSSETDETGGKIANGKDWVHASRVISFFALDARHSAIS